MGMGAGHPDILGLTGPKIRICHQAIVKYWIETLCYRGIWFEVVSEV